LFTFAFSWLLWIPSFIYGYGTIYYDDWVGGLRVLGTFGPTIAGFLLIYMEERSLGAFDLLRRGYFITKNFII